MSAKGIIKRDCALLRRGAQAGDLICVSGFLGDGAVGLACKLNQITVQQPEAFIDALEITEPRNALGQLLTEYASSCIDISDGLTQDLQHILDAAICSAKINMETLPLSPALKNEVLANTLTEKQALHYALTGGDDYELLFTINKQQYKQLCITQTHFNISVIGEIESAGDNRLSITLNGETVARQFAGWDHFK